MIYDDFKKYTDLYGLVQGWPQPGDRCGNGLRFTGEKMLSLQNRGLLRKEDVDAFNASLKACEADGPGNYLRDPKDRSSEQMDDLVSIAVASKFCGTEHAKWIVKYGHTHFFAWKCLAFPFYFGAGHDVEPNGVAEWLGRSPSVQATLQWAADEKPALWRRFALAVAIAITGLNRETNGEDIWVYSWMGIKASDGRCWMVNLAEKIFNKKFAKAWPGGWTAMYAKYFADPNHPVSKYPPQLK